MGRNGRIDYYFWHMSDWAYFGHPRLEQMADRQGVSIDYMPVDLPYIYTRTGGILLHQRAKERQDYRLFELKRFRELLGIPLNLEPKFFPVSGDLASCVTIAAKRRGLALGRLVPAMMRAVWAEDRDVSDPATVAAVATEVGFDGKELVQAAAAGDIKAEYRRYTEEAIGRGVFGSPFYFFETERFWGQDRLEHLERAIEKSRWAKASASGQSKASER
jgi:2-hydroxychromene-2-carboxylate isomerase